MAAEAAAQPIQGLWLECVCSRQDGRMGQVMRVLRYPLKSARGERLDTAYLEAGGLCGDRSWACIDVADGTVGSAKHPRRWGALLQAQATLVGGRGGDESAVVLYVAGRTLLAGGDEADAALSALVGREVRLSRNVPTGARLHRLLPDQPGMMPEWMTGAVPGREMVTDIAGARPGGRFVDFAAVHLVTTGALAELAQRLGRSAVGAERFRPNIVMDAPADPEPGQQLLVGDAVLRVLMPTPRCVVPALEHREEPADRALLAVLARDYRADVQGRGRAACFGTYAEVLEPGRVRVGQHVRCVRP